MCLNIAVPSSKLSIIESSRMSLYQIDGALPPADEYANVLGMLVGRPDVKFQFGKNHWTFLVMQSEKKLLKIRYESESAEQDLHLNRLDQFSGTIVFIMGIDLDTIRQFGYAELTYSEHLLLLTLEHESIANINKFLKAGSQ